MGAIRSAVNSFSSNEEAQQAEKELLNTLASLAETKADHFVADVTRELLEAGSAGNWTIPIKAVLKTSRHTHAYHSDNADNISSTVNTALGDFVTGTKSSILGGVQTLITGAIQAFFGDTSSSTSVLEDYYVMTEGLSIIRVDIRGWYLNVQTEAIKTTVEKVSAFVLFKSSVDVSSLDYNTFLNLYQDQIKLAATATSDEIVAELESVYQIFNKFKELDPV